MEAIFFCCCCCFVCFFAFSGVLLEPLYLQRQPQAAKNALNVLSTQPLHQLGEGTPEACRSCVGVESLAPMARLTRATTLQ